MAASKYRQSGVAMTEFVIVLPAMLLLMLGVTELGRAMVRYNALTKSVQEGARYAAAYALLGTTGALNIDAQLTGEVRNVVVYGNSAGVGTPILAGLTPAQISVAGVGGQDVSVTAVYPYVPLIAAGFPTFGFGTPANLTFNMQAGVNMRAL